jgi:hypothetical protein
MSYCCAHVIPEGEPMLARHPGRSDLEGGGLSQPVLSLHSSKQMALDYPLGVTCGGRSSWLEYSLRVESTSGVPLGASHKWIEADIAMDFASKEAQPCRASRRRRLKGL